MSIKYMNRVWEIQELKGGRLLMMLAIADHANDAGEAWPHQKTLAKKARLDARQARRVEDSLVAEDYLLICEKVVEGKMRRVYKLFPTQADKMSAEKDADKMSSPDSKADKMSAQKAVKMSGGKRTFRPQYSGHFGQPPADISAQIPSHARSESPIEPKAEASVNRIVPSDPWAVCLAELARTLPSGFVPTLTDSRIEPAPSIADERGNLTPLYRVLIAPAQAANGLGHFAQQAGPTIRRKLGGVLGKPVLIEIVAAEAAELEPTV